MADRDATSPLGTGPGAPLSPRQPPRGPERASYEAMGTEDPAERRSSAGRRSAGPGPAAPPTPEVAERRSSQSRVRPPGATALAVLSPHGDEAKKRTGNSVHWSPRTLKKPKSRQTQQTPGSARRSTRQSSPGNISPAPSRSPGGRRMRRAWSSIGSVGMTQGRRPSRTVLARRDSSGRAKTLVIENLNGENSPFRGWPEFAIQLELVAEDVEVIGARFLSYDNWVEIITEYYKVKWLELGIAEMPAMPRPWSPDELGVRTAAAITIQNCWWSYQKRRQTREDETIAQALHEAQAAPQLLEAQRQAVAHRTLHHAGAEDMSSPDAEWQTPDLRIAHGYVDTMHPRDPRGRPFKVLGPGAASTGRYCLEDGWGEQCDLWNEAYVSDFAVYGSGITNYFKMIKWCAWVFLVLGAVHVPHMIINAGGEGYTANNGVDRLSITTIGNLGSQQNVTSKIPGCAGTTEDLNGIDCTMNRERLGNFYAYTDVLVVVFFAAAWIWLRIFHAEEVDFIDSYTVTAADYSVYIPKVPPGTTTTALRAHFASALEVPVTDVAVAQNQRKLFTAFKRRGKRIVVRHRAAEKLKYLYSNYGDESCSMIFLKFQRDRLERRVVDLREDIERLNVDLGHTSGDTSAVGAYVTFQRTEDRAFALQAFEVPLWKRVLSWCGFYPRRLLYQDPETRRRHPLQVLPAPDPSTIIWENQGTPFIEKIYFRTITTLVAAGMVAAVVFVSACSVWYQKTQVDTDKELEQCVNFDDFTELEKLAAVAGDDTYLPCYCQQFNWLSLSSADDAYRGDCTDYLQDQTISSVLQTVVSATASFFALAFNTVIKTLSSFEGHISQDAAAWNVFGRLFVLKFVTLGLVVLVVHLDSFVDLLPAALQYDTQEFFNTAWFVQSGTQVMLTMMVTSVGSHVLLVGKYLRQRRARDRASRGLFSEAGIYTQEHLNQSLIGGHFFFYERYAELLSFFFICFMYGPGMPLLYVIGFVGCTIFYFVDKVMFAHFYREPPRYSEKIGAAAVNLLPFALAFHLALSLWMYGGAPIFNEEAEDKPLRILGNQPVLGLAFCAICVVIAIRVLRHELATLLRYIVSIVPCLSCCRDCFSSHADVVENVVTVSYDHAKLRGQLQGLVGYHVLQNPVYREAFGLGLGLKRAKSTKTMQFEAGGETVTSQVQQDMARTDEELSAAKRRLAASNPEQLRAAARRHRQERSIASRRFGPASGYVDDPGLLQEAGLSPGPSPYGTASSRGGYSYEDGEDAAADPMVSGLGLRQKSRRRLAGLYQRPEVRFHGRSTLMPQQPSIEEMEFRTTSPYAGGAGAADRGGTAEEKQRI